MKQAMAVVGGALLLVMACVVSGSARAQTVDEIIALAQKGVAEEVMMAAVENTKTGFQLSAADVVKLKDNKVPDKVITAMLRHRPGAPAPAAVPAVPAAPVIAAANGILNIENLDDRTWSYSYEPESKTIWISSRAADGRGNVDPHGGLSIRMPAGTYKVRYNGRDSGPSVTVFSGDKSLIMISRVSTAELEALYATVFERGDKKASDRIATLRDSESNKGSYNGGATQERIVAVPATTTYVYRSSPVPVYDLGYPSYYGYWPYYSGPRYHYPSFGFGYSRFGHRSGFGVRLGF